MMRLGMIIEPLLSACALNCTPCQIFGADHRSLPDWNTLDVLAILRCIMSGVNFQDAGNFDYIFIGAGWAGCVPALGELTGAQSKPCP
jgi:hypothetical protein